MAKYRFNKDFTATYHILMPPFTPGTKQFLKGDIIDGISNGTTGVVPPIVTTTLQGTLPQSGMVGMPTISIPASNLEPMPDTYIAVKDGSGIPSQSGNEVVASITGLNISSKTIKTVFFSIALITILYFIFKSKK